MKYKIPLFIFILTLLPSIAFGQQYKVVRVYDGDTVIAIDSHDQKIKVRLVGIDAPERSRKKRQPGQPFSTKATKYLASLVLNKKVSIRNYGKGWYGRMLGEIFVGNTNVNLEMVKAGYAENYRGRPAHGFNTVPYKEAEREARENSRGMWSLGAKFVSPKAWRKAHRHHTSS